MSNFLSNNLVEVKLGTLTDSQIDGIVYVATDLSGKSAPETLRSAIASAAGLDDAFGTNVTIIPVTLPAKRLIFSPVGKLTDYDDVRSYEEATRNGIKRALAAGVKAPLLVLPKNSVFPKADLVTLLGALEALYVPIQVRKDLPNRATKAKVLSVVSEAGDNLTDLLKVAAILEEGRFIARDIGGGDPECMTAPRILEYVQDAFLDSDNVKIEVVDKEEAFASDYPLFAAVNRAASVIERHRGRIVYLRYEPTGPVEKTIYLVGKGITYDTGGADIKTDGKMVGMSRDKCGAAAVAGFMKVVARLAPPNLRIVGALCLARNSVGENAYVADEVITGRSGARVRVGNTDAEGRMVMADVLCKLKEEAVAAVNPHLFTIATLTGHAALTAGPYAIAIDNSVAHVDSAARSIQAAGTSLGDPFEVSILRREDFKKHAGKSEGDDCHQSGNAPSAKSTRGHQGPAAFLIVASGLDKYGITSETPLKYTHLDIAGSAGDPPLEPTGAPLLALYGTFLAQAREV